MPLRRASLILPCTRLDDFPTHFTGLAAAELLAAWTALWHPSLLATTGRLPGWHSADAPPDPGMLEGELVLVPSVSRQQLPSDWCERFAATAPRNPTLVEVLASRDDTITTSLAAASIDARSVTDSIARDFLAVGYAHLQIELLTRAMHYAAVLDSEQFSAAVMEAATAAVTCDDTKAHDELARAFDLLMDARNHVYSVDFYVVDVMLLAETTLGKPLHHKLASGFPTNLLATGELIQRMAEEHPTTLAELQRAIDAGTACVFGGAMRGGRTAGRSPEAILAELLAGREVAQQHLSRPFEIFGQFDSGYSPLLPEILHGCGFNAALHAAFDGGPLPRAQQRKTRWGSRDGAQLDALSATPLDVSRPETWLQFADRASDTIAHDHVATILLAGWPGQACEYHDDLLRAAAYVPVLGRPVTLDEYFRITREIDDWSTFEPSEYPQSPIGNSMTNPISSHVESFGREFVQVRDCVADGLVSLAAPTPSPSSTAGGHVPIVINPWNTATSMFVGLNPTVDPTAKSGKSALIQAVPGCGYAVVESSMTEPPPAPLAEGRTLRNEHLEVIIHEESGGIQSLKRHSDRRTRLSQRLVMHDERVARTFADANHELEDRSRLETSMHADRIEVSHCDEFFGEITSRGRLLDAAGDLLAQFKQSLRLVRRLPVVLVDVELDAARPPQGDVWTSYFASRIAWSGDALSIRRGAEWVSRPTSRKHIESPEWVQISTNDGSATCYGLGLRFHRLASASWLDTLLLVEGEKRQRFHFALGIDNDYPSQTALAIATCGNAPVASWPERPSASTGWFLHASSKNVIITHVSPTAGDRPGMRLRMLETEGRSAHLKLSAFRPIRAAMTTDFLGQPSGLLSVVDGQVRLDIDPNQWLQIEAEW